MTKSKPEKVLRVGDIPARADGAAKYTVGQKKDGGWGIYRFRVSDGQREFVSSADSEQHAIRHAIRYQKRENLSKQH